MPGSHKRLAKMAKLSGAMPSGGPSRDFCIVGVGASAGGLEACRKLIGALPVGLGMAFIIVQHLDPTHESMMVDLLAGHTTMSVLQAADGMPIEAKHIYVIPPGTYLAVRTGTLHLSQPEARHGARLPFDFLLHSLAEDCGARAIGVILSGTGADGRLGLQAVKRKGGFVIAQDPGEAGYDGMPRSAILTGAVDQVLPAAEIAGALVGYGRPQEAPTPLAQAETQDWLPDIVDLLRTKTAHDFSLYKPGTLRRQIARAMARTAIGVGDTKRYLDLLRRDARELDRLANDLLINVTSFFRDPRIFDLLARQTVPDLLRSRTGDDPVRIWIVGCSTGEEAYSLAMLFREAIVAVDGSIKLQVFASDIDQDAIDGAREGFYPKAIEAEVSPERLARFFSKEDHGYRVLPDLRAAVVFTAQDVLADPPFSRIDLVSCRNLLIYLGPEAQAKAMAVFHFALRQGGVLVLGGSETAGDIDGRFEVLSKSERLYRRIGRNRPGEFEFPSIADGSRALPRPGQNRATSRPAVLADLCRRLVLETYAPAAVLIDRHHECLHATGPVDRYLSVAPGRPSHDLIAMVRQDMRTRLRSAIQKACQDNLPVSVAGGRIHREGQPIRFRIDVQPVSNEGESLLLIGFVDEPRPEPKHARGGASADGPRMADLERELDATRAELQGAIRNLELSNEDQKAINAEALSINEEYQATNEELLASKEELQSLNEELNALNGQLQETLERQRRTSDDLQNVLYSTDVATIFLDTDLKIRFFTPATKGLFSVIPSDVGRPLADLHSLAADGALLTDAKVVLQNLAPIEREIAAESGAWYVRRILPYRTQANGVEGVVVTFTDTTDRRHAADALEEAKRQAQVANFAKSRFLAAASHDLRQPLQTLVLLQGLLAKVVEGERARKLVARLDETLSTMSDMLNTLLDINQIESGTVRVEKVTFRIDDLVERLRGEFAYPAQAQNLTLRVVPCSLVVESDPRLLEQMVRNLLSNALKYTKRGKVLLGCRRHEDMLSIEIWDTGVGIAAGELQAIFEEYHQLDNEARERSRGLGLGLSIVQRLGDLLNHRVRVRSRPGKGSAFAIEVLLPPDGAISRPEPNRHDSNDTVDGAARRTGTILVVEDDPGLRELLGALLTDEGHHVATAADGPTALERVAGGSVRPDLVLADYNLPNGLDGLKVSAKIRDRLNRHIPIAILTGDISTDTLRNIAGQDCVHLNKPVKSREMVAVVRRLLAGPLPMAPRQEPATAPVQAASGNRPTIYVVDDDSRIRETIREVLEADGRTVEAYPSCEAFLDAYQPGRGACLLIDAYLPGMNGLALLQRLADAGHRLPAIMITGNSDVHIAVQAMKAGAFDFIEKPIGSRDLLASVERALEQSWDSEKLFAWRETAASSIADLTPRQRQIMDLVLDGHPSKNIAADLGISQRTVENHRASIMKRTGSTSLPALARLALAAARNTAVEPVPPAVVHRPAPR